jgi:HJR/Mrr/RecB family endonuclease
VALGAQVELISSVGDNRGAPDVDMVATFADRRIAILAKGYYNVANDVAVQRVVAGMASVHCHGCAVITSSRYTRTARDLARSNGCTLIGEHNFEDFVSGKIDL